MTKVRERNFPISYFMPYREQSAKQGPIALSVEAVYFTAILFKLLWPEYRLKVFYEWFSKSTSGIPDTPQQPMENSLYTLRNSQIPWSI